MALAFDDYVRRSSFCGSRSRRVGCEAWMLRNPTFPLEKLWPGSSEIRLDRTAWIRCFKAPTAMLQSVAERVLLLLTNERYLSLIIHNREAILPIVIPALEINTTNHWNQTVLNMTHNIKKIFTELDQRAVVFKRQEDNLNTENQMSASENQL